MNNKFVFECPECKGKSKIDLTREEIIKTYIGSTTDCSYCNALLQISEDLTVINFGKKLQKAYEKMGCKCTIEEAKNSFIEF
jgi:hypothetical protein